MPVDQRIEFRVGVHQGDIVVEDQHIFGAGLNVAAGLRPWGRVLSISLLRVSVVSSASVAPG